MSNEVNQILLERFYQEALGKGLTEKQANDYANNMFFNMREA
jgi:hypothetical protein